MLKHLVDLTTLHRNFFCARVIGSKSTFQPVGGEMCSILVDGNQQILHLAENLDAPQTLQ